MGLYEQMLQRVFPDAVKFPELIPEEDKDAARLPRLSDLPQTLLPPHLRRAPPTVDASQPAIQTALGNTPAGPAIPAALQVEAGMIPPLNSNQPPFLTEPAAAMQRLVDPNARAEPVPLPMARPAGADAVPLPVPRPPMSDEVGARARTPAPPMPIAPAVPPAAAPAPVAPAMAPQAGMIPSAGGSSILDRIASTLGDNSNTLLALGAGFAGAPGWGQAISRASAAAIPARAADIKQSIERGGRGTVTQALLNAGVPAQQAIAAQYDPDLRKKLIDAYIVDRKSEIKTIKSKDMFGNETEQLVGVNPYDLTTKPITGGGDAAGGTVASGGKNATFAPGITMQNFDGTKSGDEYLAQFSPEVQSGVKAYLRGDSMPSNKNTAQAVKMVAQKYGEDIGVPANDQDYIARKNFKSSLGDTKSGVGLQVRGFQQGTAHLADAAEKMAKLKNVNGLGSADLAHAANAVKNRTTGQAGIIAGLDADGQALAGEVGKLYSGSTGGGVHEREATKKLFANPSASAEEQAGALEATLSLMEGGLNTLEGRKRALFKDQQIPGGEFVGAEEQRNIERVRKAIKVLRGEATETTPKAAAAPKAPPPGTYVWDPATQKLVPAK